jgi:glutamyl-tRNA synthetase/nondiscriminating glutamyl-tRNA synthetase
MVRGVVEFPNEAVSDPIIVRSTGIPVYNYVVVVDDIEMKITHVIRGDDHLSNTPKQVALYEALGAKPPEFAHLSTILGADRERLSKRHGATSIANFRDMGVLPEALTNYLALLGWAPSGGDREVFTLDELVKEFRLDRVTPSPAVFDMEKLYWLNRHYIKVAEPERIHRLALRFFADAGLMHAHVSGETAAWLGKVTDLLVPSVNKLDELPSRAAVLFEFDPNKAIAAADNAEVMTGAKTPAVLDAFAAKIRAEQGEISAERFKAILKEVQTETGVKGKELFHPIRVMLTGAHSGPEFDKLVPLIETGSKLGLPKQVLRIRDRVDAFQKARGV